MSRELFVRLGLAMLSATLMIVFALSSHSLAQSNDKTNQLRIVVFGDSLVAGYGLGPGEGFPEQLQKAVSANNQNIVIENAGVSGDTTSGGLARLDWSVPDGTNGVILELGANDALRGISPKLTKENLTKMISRLKERNIKVLLVGMIAPPNMGEDYGKQFNPIYKNLATQEDLVLYPFFLDGVAGVPSLNQADAIHPTADGIAIMVDKFLPTMQTFIQRLK